MLGRFTFTVISFILFSKISTAQVQLSQLPQPTEIYGKVTDAATKEPLADVNIRLSGSFKTTMTDPKGQFSIRTIDKVDSISFSYIGFRTRTIAIKRGSSENMSVELGSDVLRLTEVSVKSGKKHKRVIDTTANYVYYQVLKNKGNNRSDNINTYKYDSYEKLEIALFKPSDKLINFVLFKPFRFAFENRDTTEEGIPFIPGLLKETVSKVYYRKKPKSIKNIITAENLSGIDNASVGNLAKYNFAEIDPYENLFVIVGKSFVAPFSPRGMGIYFYYLTDTAKIDGRVSYKLHFVGKVKEDLALKGYAWIDSATWAIRSIVFRPNEKANFNFINDYTIKQDYLLLHNKYWLLKREEMRTLGSLFNKKNTNGLLITKVLYHRNFDTDGTFDDSIFKGPEEHIILDGARDKPQSFWDSLRFEPLTRQEKEVYHIADTIKLVKAWKAYEWVGRFMSNAYADAGPISISRVLNVISHNNVEGYRLRFGFESNPRFQHKGTAANDFLHLLYFNTYVAYGLGDKVFQYEGTIRINLPRPNDRWHSLVARYRYDMVVPGSDPAGETPLLFDHILTLLTGNNLTKIMRVRELRVADEKDWVSDFSTIESFVQQTYYDVPGVFNFSHMDKGVAKGIPNFNITEFVVDSRYSYNNQSYYANSFWRIFFQTKYPVLMFRYTAGIVDMKSSYYNYHNLMFTLKQRLSSIIGHTNYILTAGKILGQVPYLSAYQTEGNLGILYNRFSYNLLGEYEFVTDQFVSLWIEHHFEGFLLNKIPGINKLRLRELIFVKSLYGSFNDKNYDVLSKPAQFASLTSPSKLPYVEAGFGIENIAYLFRVDFVWRVTYRNKSGEPNWGVKLAFQPGF